MYKLVYIKPEKAKKAENWYGKVAFIRLPFGTPKSYLDNSNNKTVIALKGETANK